MTTQKRIRILKAGLVCFFLLILARSFYWQVIKRESLAIAADKQHLWFLEIPAARGEIRDRQETALVYNQANFQLLVNKTVLRTERNSLVEEVVPPLLVDNPLLATDEAERQILKEALVDRLNQAPSWVRLAGNVGQKGKDLLAKKNIAGLVFVPAATRAYLESSMAGHLLGFVAEDKAGQKKGFFGLEGFFDKELAGKPGRIREERDAFQKPILIGTQAKLEPIAGSDLELTINRNVQFFVERYLLDGVQTWGAEGGSALVLDPNTGEVIASASFPRYPPANYAFSPPSLYNDPVISDLYEPGSVVKPLVMAAAFNEQLLTPVSRCSECTGPIQIGMYDIHTFNDQYHPDSTMSEVLVNSDNTGMVYVGRRLGFTRLYRYLVALGFGQRTGVELEGEAASPLREERLWYPIDQATVTFGQGLAVTPIQLTRAFSVLANGGRLLSPTVVRAVITKGKRREFSPSRGRKVLSPVVAQLLTEMLVRVTNESPLRFPKERTAGIERFRVAAKSGTAQVPIAGHYEEDRTIASVIGYAPAENPRFLVLVKLDSPTVRPWGSDTAGPIFFRIMADLLAYYNISPNN